MDDDVLAAAQVLVVGPHAALAEALRGGPAEVHLATDVEEALRMISGASPDVIVASSRDEATLRRHVDPLRLGTGPAVVAGCDLAAGDEVVAEAALRRLRLVLERRALRTRVAELESAVAHQAVAARRDVEAANLDTLRRLAVAAEYLDDNTPEHTERVAHLAALLGRQLRLPDRSVWLIRQAAPLHDLGKIAVPETILLKPGRLTPEEFDVVKTHPIVGARVLAGGSSELIQVAEQIARSHHERWDGAGYPDGAAAEEIPMASRLVHVADVFDVVVHERPYGESMSAEQAAGEIRDGAGGDFDPDVVQAFVELGPRAWEASLGAPSPP